MGQSKSAKYHIIDKISIATGELVSWLTLFMVLATFVVVVLRYVFGVGVIWLQESVTWMHAAVFMLGAAYTLQADEHVRVDVFYRDMTAKRKALVDLFGSLCFLFPLCGFVFYESYNYVADAWLFSEGSRNSGGLAYPAVPLLKSILLIMPVAVILQGISITLKSIDTLRGR